MKQRVTEQGASVEYDDARARPSGSGAVARQQRARAALGGLPGACRNQIIIRRSQRGVRRQRLEALQPVPFLEAVLARAGHMYHTFSPRTIPNYLILCLWETLICTAIPLYLCPA